MMPQIQDFELRNLSYTRILYISCHVYITDIEDKPTLQQL